MANFHPSDRLTSFLLPPSVDEWLPQGYLAWFVTEVIGGLDLTAMSNALSWHWFGVLPPVAGGEDRYISWRRIGERRFRRYAIS